MNTTPLQIANLYFDLSNKSDLVAIKSLFTESSTYSSANTGVYLGTEQIMEMMTNFHESFNHLSWKIHSVKEIRPGVIEFDFEFNGTTKNGQLVQRPGTEYVIVYAGKLQHVEVRNK